MKRQHGQSAVEFALMAPFIFVFIFGMIYGGIMFMEYLHYNNAVRTAARTVAVADPDVRDTVRQEQEDWLNELWQKEAGITFYEPTASIPEIEDGAEDIVVNVTFERKGAIPNILNNWNFPPKRIKALSYRMRIEKSDTENTGS